MFPPDKKLVPPKAGKDSSDLVPPVSPSAVLHPSARKPVALSAPPSMTTLLQGLRRCWGRVLALALLGGVLGVIGACLVIPGRFTTAVLLQVSSRPPRGSWEGDSDFANFQKTQA